MNPHQSPAVRLISENLPLMFLSKLFKSKSTEIQRSASAVDEPARIETRSPEPVLDEATQPKPSFDDEMVSTTVLGKTMGVRSPFLFTELIRLGCIEKTNYGYILTELGASAEFGGRYMQARDGNDYITWPPQLGDSLLHVKKALLDRTDFRLYHMTHVRNLPSILEHGLFSHNQAPRGYLDISNQDVNKRRERTETVHKKSLHEYVPMYFNPRNAMLYAAEKAHPDDIIILEIDRRVCLSKYTLYTDRNAAANECRFFHCLSDAADFDWPKIQSRSWVSDGIVDIDTKQTMMSECLVYGHVKSVDLMSVHTKSESARSRLRKELWGLRELDTPVSIDLFFPKDNASMTRF